MSSSEASEQVTTREDGLACDHCKRSQANLHQPLRRCAKCHITPYCSRGCQKAGWSTHKHFCTRNATGTASPPQDSGGSFTNPSHEEMVKRAKQTMALCNALTDDPQLDWQDIERSPSTLRHVFGFVRNTWEQYWCLILAPRVANSIRSGGDRMRMEFYAMYEPSLRNNTWPEFDREKYWDCFTRDFLISMIIQKPEQQILYGGPYPISQAVMDAALAISPVPRGTAE